MGNRRWWAIVAAALVVAVTAGPAHAAGAPVTHTGMQHLQAIVDRSPAPSYRRFGSAGMVAVSDYAATTLENAGYAVRRHSATAPVWQVDYAAGHEPLLERTSDGHRYVADSAFWITPSTADGVTCTLRAYDEVTPGDCGFVPFAEVSPEWKNLEENTVAAIDTIVARGGVGAVLQGDVARNAVIAKPVHKTIPVVVSPVADTDVVDQPIRLRAMGQSVTGTLHNVIGVRPPADPTKGYFVLQGHMDGWYQAAADNGTGAAAVLATAELLAGADRERGLIVALYDGEEWGLLGSKAVAADLSSADGLHIGPCTADVHMGDIAAVVNLDAPSAIASDGDGALEEELGIDVPLFSWRAMVFSEEPTLPGVFLAGMTAHQVLGAPINVQVANPANGGVQRTDAKWFDDAGLAIVWPVAGYPEYHTSADTLAAVDPVDLEHVVAGAAEVIRDADAVPVQRHATLAEPGSFGETVDPDACAAATPAVPELGGRAALGLGVALATAAAVACGRRRRSAQRRA